MKNIPAFPVFAFESESTSNVHLSEGMNLLDYFAAKAMHALMNNPECFFKTMSITDRKECSVLAYKVAIEMLNARANLTSHNNGLTVPPASAGSTQTAENKNIESAAS